MANNDFTRSPTAFDAASLVSGTVDMARIPVGSTGTTVAYGNHTHPDSDSIYVARPGDDLNAKIAALVPGDILYIQGSWSLAVVVGVSGTSTKPITIIGDGCTINHPTGRTGTGYALSVTGSYLHFVDIMAGEAGKAVVIDGSTNVRFDRCTGFNTATEVWKVRNSATYIYFADCIADGGGMGGTYGEGFYIGQASTNWTPTAGVTPDTTSYVRIERCLSVRCSGDGVDIKEGAHHVVVKDHVTDFTKGNAPIKGATFGDSGVYSRGDTCQFINVHSRGVPGDGLKLYDVVVNAITYGRTMEVWGGLVEGAGGAGVASQSDDLKVYSNFLIAGTVTDGRTNVVGGGWTSAYDPTTFVEQSWTSSAAQYENFTTKHAGTHGIGGTDRLTPAMIGASDVSHTHAGGAHTHVESDVTNLIADLASKADSSHTHVGSDISSGTVNINRIPTGTTGTTVTLGNDSRLSDARTPLTHVHSAADLTSGAIPTARIPVVISPPATVTYAAALTVNANNGNNFQVTATGNITSFAITGTSNGEMIVVEILASGSARTFTTTIALTTGLTVPLTITSGKVAYIGCRYSSLLGAWQILSMTQGL